ncbi:MAG TPA: MoaD/ThiS family protein [Candidatus Binatia bacterium]
MTIKIKVFASLRERLGRSELVREVAEGATAGDVLATLRSEYPALTGTGRLAIAVNAEYVDPGHALADGDELALIPPVSGGCRVSARPE